MFTNLSVDVNNLPKTANIDLHSIEKRWRYKLVCERLLAAIILITVAILIIPEQVQNNISVGLYLLIALLAGRALIWSFIEYPYKAYGVREKDIFFKTGVLWRSETVIAYNRIQHVELKHGVFDRFFHLADLEIFTAGGNASDLLIPGLDEKHIESLRGFILEKANKSRE